MTQPQPSLPPAFVSPVDVKLLLPPLPSHFPADFPNSCSFQHWSCCHQGVLGPQTPGTPCAPGGDMGVRMGSPVPLPTVALPGPTQAGLKGHRGCVPTMGQHSCVPSRVAPSWRGGGHLSDPQDAAAGTGKCQCHHPCPHLCPTHTQGPGGSRGSPSPPCRGHSTHGCSPSPTGPVSVPREGPALSLMDLSPTPQPLFASPMASPALEFAYKA